MARQVKKAELKPGRPLDGEGLRRVDLLVLSVGFNMRVYIFCHRFTHISRQM